MRRHWVLIPTTGLVVVGTLGVVSAIGGRPDKPVVVHTEDAAGPACQAPTYLLRATGPSEELLAGWVPEGFVKSVGDDLPAQPRLAVTYSGADGRSYLELSRVLTSEPARELLGGLGPGATASTTTVHGQPADLVQGRDLEAGGGSRIVIAWKELPDVTMVASGYRSSLEQVQRWADTSTYRRGELPPGTESSACHRVLPAGALSRTEVLAAASFGPAPEAKLVRLADLEAASPGLLQCEDTGCDPSIVAWAVLTHAFAARYGSPMGPAPTGPGWSLIVVDASTGRSRGGLASGPGEYPQFWPSLEDLAP